MSETFIKAGVIGWPIKHSRSPLIHRYWIEQLGLSGSYDAVAVDPARFADDLQGLIGEGYAGVNVTVPHKEAALDIAETVDDLAARIGAANTLVFRDGKIEARNTDAHGFLANLMAGAPDLSLKGQKAVVLGAGGAARAVLCALVDAEVAEIVLVNRTRARAEEVALSLNGDMTVTRWEHREEALEEAALLVNTTTLGMTGAPALDLSLDRLPESAVVNDIVYAPLETDLLSRARARGNQVVDGLGMLLHQAAPAFEAWFGVLPEVDKELRSRVVADLENS